MFALFSSNFIWDREKGRCQKEEKAEEEQIGVCTSSFLTSSLNSNIEEISKAKLRGKCKMLISQCFKAKTLGPKDYICMISFLPKYLGRAQRDLHCSFICHLLGKTLGKLLNISESYFTHL